MVEVRKYFYIYIYMHSIQKLQINYWAEILQTSYSKLNSMVNVLFYQGHSCMLT